MNVDMWVAYQTCKERMNEHDVCSLLACWEPKIVFSSIFFSPTKFLCRKPRITITYSGPLGLLNVSGPVTYSGPLGLLNDHIKTYVLEARANSQTATKRQPATSMAPIPNGEFSLASLETLFF